MAPRPASRPPRRRRRGHAGVRAARVLRWEERLALLRDAGRWRHALLLGLDILAAARASAARGGASPAEPGFEPGGEPGGAPRPPARAAPSRGDGRGADVAAVSAALVAALLGFLDAALACARAALAPTPSLAHR
jgi:hypothetical protein